MCWSHKIELAAWVIGAVCALLVLLNKKARDSGIGPYTTRALTITLGIPLLLTLAMEKVLTGETIAALIGGLLGIGIQKDKDV
jgi:hypothetical protein